MRELIKICPKNTVYLCSLSMEGVCLVRKGVEGCLMY